MHEMQTIVTDLRGVCPSVCQSVCHAMSFDAAFAKLLWPRCYFRLTLFVCASVSL